MQVVLLRTIAAAFLLLLTASASHAVILDWSTAPAWTGTSNSYDVDGGGNDITVSDTITGSAAFATGFPQIATFNTPGSLGLLFRVSTMGTLGSGQVAVTITFTGAYATSGVITSFTLHDVDKDFVGGNFQDRVTLSALALDGTTALPVTLTNTGGTSVNTISGSPGTSPDATGNAATTTDPNGDVTVTAGTFANPVTSITFVWDNPDAANRTVQTINLGNITFTAVPEVATSSIALCLCGGLLALGRRRIHRTAA